MSKPYFQHLPEHIIDQIVGYALQMYYGYTSLHGHVALTILHSSHRWRHTLIKKTCDELQINYGPKSKCRHNITNWPQALDDPCFPFYHFVKHFRISTEWQHVVDGSTLKFLRDEIPSDSRFDSAQSLELYIQGSPTLINILISQMSEAFNNIAEFIKVAKCMVPNIREIRIDWTYPSFLHSNRKYDLSFKDLVADILHGMPAVRFIEKTKLPLSTMLEPSSFQNLSSLTYVYCAAHTWFANVIRKRSRTLIELRLLMVPKAVMNNLIFDDNGNPIVYRLLKLLDISHDDTSEYKYLDSQVTHFPDIKRFVLFGEYPFATSQPFSSTISSLESLNISLFSFKSDCDKKIKALLSGKLQNLKTVCFFNTVNNPSRNLVERYRDDGAQIYPIEAILKNTNSIRNFKLVGTSFDKDVVLNMITTHTAFKHMHSIHVGYCNLEFPSIVQILALVPNLRYFCCGLASEFPQMDGCQQNELIQLIDAELSPMNKNIVTLDINNADSMPVEFIVETVAMLVIGCPRLSQLVIDLSDMYSFIDMVDDFARELPFPDHTSRLLGFTNNIYPQE